MDILEKTKKEAFRRRLSHETIKTYLFCIRKFLKFCNKEPIQVTKADVREYIESLSKKNKSGSTLNVHLNSVKFMLEEVLHRRWKLNIKYSKTPKKLPTVLSKEEISQLLNSIKNEKRKLMISLMYGAGLRLSELIKLKVKDLELEQNYGWVRHGKGNKDRTFIIPKKLQGDIKKLAASKQQFEYLFDNKNGCHLTKEAIYKTVRRAAKKAQLKKRVHPHTLRHSFATHLIQENNDIVSVQSLLGHNSPETTMVYVHTARSNMLSMKSPLDSEC